jgi:ubiquinol-cytochrome c reductase cytochrome c1 subunit
MIRICFLSLLFFSIQAFALEKAPIQWSDKASLQRGARVYFNYCSGCHSLRYMRYNRLAKDLGIVDADGHVLDAVVKQNFMFSSDKIAETIKIAMPAADARQWFGVTPPDLSLVARARGADWLYTFLLSFYQDTTRPLGANNLVYKDVAMPNVLLPLQGTQLAVFNGEGHDIVGDHVFPYLKSVENGTMTAPEFRSLVLDLVNFLVYVSDPSRQERESLGRWVLLFLIIFVGLLYLLKKEYWKNVKRSR